MRIQLIVVGKLKEKYWADAVSEYLKRLSAFSTIEIKEVPDEKAGDNLSEKEEELVRLKEAERILAHIKPDRTVVVLAIDGKDLSSEGIAEKLQSWALEGKSDVVFVIGGSLGLHKSVIDRAHFLLSFGKKTYPHQLMRVILLEQIYRAFKIIRGEPYHK